jgi:hypothetical protein
MSSNLAVINFTVGGTLTVSGNTTLVQPIYSSSTASFQGLITTSLNTTGASTFINLPTSTQTPTSNSQLTTKIYVDTVDNTLNTRITNTDADQRIYVDGSYNTQRIYIDQQDTSLNTRITNTDSAQRIYIDQQDTSLNTRITTTDADQRIYIDQHDNTLNNRITTTDADQRIYVDGSYNTLNTKIDNIRSTFDVFYAVIDANTQSFSSSAPNISFNQLGFSTTKITGFGYNNQISQYKCLTGTYYFYSNASISNISSGYLALFKNGVLVIKGGLFSFSTVQTDIFASVSGLISTNNNDVITVILAHTEACQVKGNTVTEFGGYRIK